MTISIIASPQPLHSLIFSSISATYASMGAAYTSPIRMFKFTNTTDAIVYLSTDGVTDMFAMPIGTTTASMSSYDLCTNRESAGSLFVLSGNTQFYVRAPHANPTLGFVIVEVICAKGQ